MGEAARLVELVRGDLLESVHLGHVAVWEHGAGLVRAWGDPDATIYPRSSCKMVQALPLVASGAADRYGLGPEHLALACASHNGAQIHTRRVAAWLDRLSLDETAFRCGPQEPEDRAARDALIRAGETPGQIHNNCSGKHAGFLTLGAYMGAGPDYVGIDHPVQQAALAAFEEATGETSPGYGIDGCSAPNFAVSLAGLARAMAWFATAAERADRQSAAALRLTQAMTAHPDLVAGEGRACTRLMRAMAGRAAIKTGAEGVFVAIVPERRMGVAVKIADGATRAAEAAIASLLVSLGVLDPSGPAARAHVDAPILNRRGLVVGEMRPVADLRARI